jgi:hypothetical protein
MAGVIASLGNLVTGGAKSAFQTGANLMPRQSNALPNNTFLTQTGQAVRQGAVSNVQAQATIQTQPQQGTTMGSLVFSGPNAFPNATQAAFGGMGGMGYGVGYGGSSEGASIIIPAEAFYQTPAAAPAGGASNYTGLVLIAGMVLVVVLVIGMMGNKNWR